MNLFKPARKFGALALLIVICIACSDDGVTPKPDSYYPFNGKDIVVLFRWDMRDREHPVWSQAFSPDKGKTWEWNWINVSYRTE